MRKSYRFVSLALVILVALASFGVVAAQDKVTINWWHISTRDRSGRLLAGSRRPVHGDASERQTSRSPFSKMPPSSRSSSTVMQAGDPPDLFQSWGGAVLWNFAKNGLVRNIAPELTADGSAWKDSFSAQAALELYGQNGEYYGVPWDLGRGRLCSTTRRCSSKPGITELPTTWTEFLDDRADAQGRRHHPDFAG